jgi:HAD superfamily hydrolase (TIGR01509 family)
MLNGRPIDMSIRALIFDFDGLILDTESTEYQSWQELFTAHGCQLSLDLWVDCIGRPRDYFDFYTHLEEVRGTAIDREHTRTQLHARVRELNLLQPIQPGVVNYLQDARQLGLKIGLASSSSRVWVHGHLERLALYQYFTATKCVEDTCTHKPDPGPYLAVLNALNVLPHEAVAFEDSPNGVTSAKAAGILCVAIPNPITQHLPLDHADYQLESFASMSLQNLLIQLTRTTRPK